MTNRISKNYDENKKEKKGFLSVKKKKKKTKNNNNNNNSNNNNKKKNGDSSATNNNKKKEIQEISEMDKLFQLIPSKTRCTDDKLFQLMPSKTGCTDDDPKTLSQLIKDANAIKKHLESQLINTKDSQLFLTTVGHVIYVVNLFCTEAKLPPFNWKTRKYPKRYLKISQHVEDNMCEVVENGFRLSGCYLVLPDFDSHGIAQVTSVTGSETDEAYARVPPSLDPNRKLPQSDDLSFDEKEKKIWLEFKEFDKENPEVEVMSFKLVEEVTRSIELDHPIVSVIGGFAVAAFNQACEMLVKEYEPNNLHDIEFMEFRYLKVSKAYYFYMTIEAIEEGNLGVYETQVVCSSDGDMRTLTKFVLTDRKPVGTKAMAISLFSCLRSVCKTLEVLKEEKLSELDKILDVLKGKGRGLPMHKLACLLELCSETIKGISQVVFLGLRLLFSPDCNRNTNPDVWYHPDNHFTSGMVHRRKGTPCRGYDYHNPFCMGSVWWCCLEAN